jgi:hypothetical protein
MPTPLLHRLRAAVLGISLKEVRVMRRGFHCVRPETAERLERIGVEFLAGYHAALEAAHPAALALRLNTEIALDYRGFAFEGAAMALFLLDRLRLSTRSFDQFLSGPGQPHVYMAHVGAGWAVARLPWLRSRLPQVLASFDPLLCWLVVDGYGFHEGYFHWRQTILRRSVPRGLPGYASRAFDQGLGRSLWFVEGIDPEAISGVISGFAEHRRGDLWSGVGLACAYAGGADFATLLRLRNYAGEYAPCAAQGAVFAAETRHRGGNPTPHCDLACIVLAGMSQDRAASLARKASEHLPMDADTPAYETWRIRIRQLLP